MTAIATPAAVPAASLLSAHAATAPYRDAWSVPLPRLPDDMNPVVVAMFQSGPRWLDGLMRLRNALVRPLGLKTGPVGAAALSPPFAEGDFIGMFRVYAVTPHEVILGEDDRHLDFRISLLVEERAPDGGILTASTVVAPHNALGRTYLRVVLPFHRFIVPVMVAGAARRLNG